MYEIHKPDFIIDGKPDVDTIENWVEKFFGILMHTFNGFYSKLDPQEMIVRLSEIPFAQLCEQQLFGQSPQVIKIGVKKINKLAEEEIQRIRAYIE